MKTDIISLIDKQTECYNPNEYPCLRKQYEEFAERKPFEGLKILDATPIFRNTLLKYKALLLGGAELYIGDAGIFQYDPEILDFLRSGGITITHANETQEFDLILDNAAGFAEFSARIGYSELTRSGVDKYKECGKPVYLADSGKIKRIETCFGTGESCFRALKHYGYDDYEGKNLVLFGSGKVGTGIMYFAKKYKMNVIVITDSNSVSRNIANIPDKIIDLHDSNEIINAVKQADFIITATGKKDAVSSVCPPNIVSWSYAVMMNMGVEDEFGENILPSRVLNNKQTGNFRLPEPTKLCYIEATMALHNYGGEFMLNNHPKGVVLPSPVLEEKMLNSSFKEGILDPAILNFIR